MAQLVKNLPAMWETWVQSLGWDDALEKGKATHSSILDWRIPQTLKSMGSQKVGHNWATFTFTSGKFDPASSNWISFPINPAVENNGLVANFPSQLWNDHLHGCFLILQLCNHNKHKLRACDGTVIRDSMLNMTEMRPIFMELESNEKWTNKLPNKHVK